MKKRDYRTFFLKNRYIKCKMFSKRMGNMKKFLIILAMFLAMPVMADTMPFYMDSIPKTALGLFLTTEIISSAVFLLISS